MAPRQRSDPPHLSASAAPFEPELLTVAEVALMCRVSKMTIYRLVRTGDLPAGRVGRSFRIRRGDVVQMLHNLGPLEP